jgi:hypothetical protein
MAAFHLGSFRAARAEVGTGEIGEVAGASVARAYLGLGLNTLALERVSIG